MAPNWFVGMPVPATGWLEELLADAPAALRCFHADDLHLTVAFLGSCGEERARAAFALTDGCEAEAFEVTLGELAPMGSRRRPSALSLLLSEGGEAAVKIMSDLRGPMWEAAEARPDGRPPKPHCTVARPSRKARAEERKRAVAWVTSKPPLGVRVGITDLCLYTWSDDRARRLFRVVERHALRHARAEPSP